MENRPQRIFENPMFDKKLYRVRQEISKLEEDYELQKSVKENHEIYAGSKDLKRGIFSLNLNYKTNAYVTALMLISCIFFAQRSNGNIDAYKHLSKTEEKLNEDRYSKGHLENSLLSCNIGAISIMDVACNSGTNLTDPSDDFISFSILVSPGTGTASTFDISSTDLNLNSMGLDYGVVHTGFQATAGSAGAGDILLTISDDSGDCSAVATVIDPGTCAFTLSCPENISNTGTTADASICADTEITLCLDGDNLPPDGEICWYQVSTSGATPDPMTDQLLACVSIPSGVTTGGPVINEVLFDPMDASDNNAGGTCEAIEIAGSPGLDLGCYILTDGDFMIVLPPGTTIPPDGFLVIADASVDCDDFDPSDVDVDLSSCGCCTSCDMVLINTGEYVNLLDPMGHYVDGIQWGAPSPANLPGTSEFVASSIQCAITSNFVTTNPSTPFTPVPTMNGESIARDPDVNGDWTNSKNIEGALHSIGSANGLPTSFCTNITLDDSFCGEIYINALISSLPGSCSASSGLGIESNFNMTCPNPQILNNGPFCPEENIALSVTEVTAVNWSWNTTGNATLVYANSDELTLTGDINDGDTFSVMVSDINGCTGVDQTTITILEPPMVTAEVLSGSCDGDEVILNAAGDDLSSFVWVSDGPGVFDDDNIASPTVTSVIDGEVFTVLVSGSNDCFNADQVVVNLDPLPTTSLTSLFECDEGSGIATFDLSAIESIVSNAASGVSVSWFSDASLTNSIATPAAYQSSSASIYAKVTDNISSCFSSTVVTLSVLPLPNPIITGLNEYCEGSPGVTLEAGTFDAYLWSPGNEISPTIIANQGSYTVTVTDANGCSATSLEFVVSENPNPTPQISGVMEYCEGDEAVVLDAGSGFDSYLWSGNDEMTQTVMVLDGSYTVTVTDSNGCEGESAPFEVVENPLPQPVIIGDLDYCPGTSGTNLDAGEGFVSYSWIPGGESSQSITVVAGHLFSNCY